MADIQQVTSIVSLLREDAKLRNYVVGDQLLAESFLLEQCFNSVLSNVPTEKLREIDNLAIEKNPYQILLRYACFCPSWEWEKFPAISSALTAGDLPAPFKKPEGAKNPKLLLAIQEWGRTGKFKAYSVKYPEDWKNLILNPEASQEDVATFLNKLLKEEGIDTSEYSAIEKAAFSYTPYIVGGVVLLAAIGGVYWYTSK